VVTVWSNGDSFGASNSVLADIIGDAVGTGTGRRSGATWKFGLRLSDDRGDI